ncbi:MAG: lipoate--protein ligase family protein [Planctomycetales bacterium]|nr:lipoate--protein ligase family protein [Planctomycetales bacterium]
MHFIDLTFPRIADNLALEEALLDEAECGRWQSEVLRFWNANSVFVVLGRSSRYQDEIRVSVVEQRNIPVFRRISGGMSVVCAPGCMFYCVLLSLKFRPHLRMLDSAHQFVIDQLRHAVQIATDSKIKMDGTCDLVVGGKKFSGNSLRIGRDWLIYHGTLLLEMDLNLVEDLLKHPPREPTYREGRKHTDFLTNLSASSSSLKQALIETWSASPTDERLPYDRISQLVEEKYSRREWNLQR